MILFLMLTTSKRTISPRDWHNTGLMVLLIISTNDSISDVDYEQENNFSKRLAQYWADGSTYNID